MAQKIEVLHETDQFRFVINGTIFHNSQPDYRLQTKHPRYGVWKDAVLFDCALQCSYAMEDLEYAKMLVGLPAYQKKYE
jgi:hypothetical protein